MANKYTGNGDLKMKILLGLAKTEDNNLIVEWDKDAPMHELVRFWGILSIEVPFLMQHLKQKQAMAEKSGIVLPEKN
jgi:hypothetical protein